MPERLSNARTEEGGCHVFLGASRIGTAIWASARVIWDDAISSNSETSAFGPEKGIGSSRPKAVVPQYVNALDWGI